jgi:hypothetical protein
MVGWVECVRPKESRGLKFKLNNFVGSIERRHSKGVLGLEYKTMAFFPVFQRTPFCFDNYFAYRFGIGR